jgi:uncharacterized RDD family membrane protein YckC
VSTTPNEPEGHEPESAQPAPERPGTEPADERDAFRDLENKPHSDEVGDTAYAAVPPPLPPTGDPAQGPVQDASPGTSELPQSGFTAPGGEQAQASHQQSPYQQQAPYQQAPPYQQQPYQQQPQYQQYPAGPSAGQQQTQYGSAGPYQAAPPPPQYGQPYGYPGGGLPTGMPPLADWSQRAAAFILDNGLAIVGGWVAGGNVNDATDVVFGILGFVGVVWAIVNAIRAGRHGQSYGKRVMGIRLARLADGQPIGGGLGFLRLFLNWLLWVLCVVPGVLNLLWPLWDRKNQTWSDKLAKSVVVKTR